MKDRASVSSFFIINLACSDFLMGLYLLIIACVDAHFRGYYIIYDDWWRSSAICQFAGFLATLSSEASVYMLTAITVDRTITILFPLKIGRMRLKSARYIALAGWILCVFLSIIPLVKIPYFGSYYFGRTGNICFAT